MQTLTREAKMNAEIMKIIIPEKKKKHSLLSGSNIGEQSNLFGLVWFYGKPNIVGLSYLSYLLTRLLEQDMTQGQFFKRSLIGLNLEYSFS